MNSFPRRILQKVILAVYPQNIYCMVCGDTIDASRVHGLCDICTKSIPWAINNPFSSYMDEFAFDDIWSVARYGSHIRGMVHSLKLHGKTYMARNMGLLMAERVLIGNMKYDALVAVPLHKGKQQRRGYNQSALLAHYAAKQLSSPFWTGGLIKTNETDSMRMADSVARRSMLADVFLVPLSYQKKMQGSHILLVDDVCTIGSTADACARALKRAGADRVTLLCFASSSGYRKFD